MPDFIKQSVLASFAVWGVVTITGCAVTSPPIDTDKQTWGAYDRINEIVSRDEPVSGPISLYEAMARALKYNLDQKIELMDEEYKSKLSELGRLGMFPSVAASVGGSQRNNDSGSSSRSLIDGSQSLQSSTSSERRTYTAQLAASWDILDFGLSYIQNKQNVDEQYISQERRRKVISRILEDVRTAYWRAVSADRTHEKLIKLEALAQKTLYQSEQLAKRRNVSPLKVLNYQHDLLEIQANVQRMQRELFFAKKQLAALINLKPETPFKLVLPDRTAVVPELPGSAEQMILIGLKYRSELRESSYRKRINDNELTKQWVRNLPSFKTLLGMNYDTNKYLYNNEWANFSGTVSWNLMNVFSYPMQHKVVQAEAKVIQAREDALIMAILTQIYVSRARFIRLSQELNTVRQSHEVQDNILELTRAGFQGKIISQMDLVQVEMKTILDEVRYDTAYADLQNAYANLYASMGIDNFDSDITEKDSVSSIAKKLQFYWTEEITTLPEVSRRENP